MPETAFSVLFIFFCLFFFWFLDFAVPDVSGLNIQLKKNNLYKTEAYKMYSIQYIYNYLYSINVHVLIVRYIFIVCQYLSTCTTSCPFIIPLCVYRNLIVCVSKENKMHAGHILVSPDTQMLLCICLIIYLQINKYMYKSAWVTAWPNGMNESKFAWQMTISRKLIIMMACFNHSA